MFSGSLLGPQIGTSAVVTDTSVISIGQNSSTPDALVLVPAMMPESPPPHLRMAVAVIRSRFTNESPTGAIPESTTPCPAYSSVQGTSMGGEWLIRHVLVG